MKYYRTTLFQYHLHFRIIYGVKKCRYTPIWETRFDKIAPLKLGTHNYQIIFIARGIQIVRHLRNHPLLILFCFIHL